MNSLLGEGYKKELEMEDLFEVRKQDESELLGDRLEKYVTDVIDIFHVFFILEIGSKN